MASLVARVLTPELLRGDQGSLDAIDRVLLATFWKPEPARGPASVIPIFSRSATGPRTAPR